MLDPYPTLLLILKVISFSHWMFFLDPQQSQLFQMKDRSLKKKHHDERHRHAEDHVGDVVADGQREGECDRVAGLAVDPHHDCQVDQVETVADPGREGRGGHRDPGQANF